MAIQVDINSSEFGIPFAAAYFRIVNASITRQRDGETKFMVIVDVAGYGTSTPNDNTRDIDFRRYGAPLEDIESQSGDGFLEKCYAWLMQQDSMSGSIAV